MREGCICGHSPPEDPNRDCERCDFVCEVERLKAELSATRERVQQAEAALYEIDGLVPLIRDPHSRYTVNRVIELWRETKRKTPNA